MAGADLSSGEVYYEVVLDRLMQEEKRAASLQARGATLITTSGVLVTLLFGVGSVVLRAQQYLAPHASRIMLACALIFFALAAALGLAANKPNVYIRPDIENLTNRLSKPSEQQASPWKEPGGPAREKVALARAKQLKTAEKVSDKTARLLLIGILLEVFAVAMVSIAMVLIIV